ncbi:[Skp1-protein]-hydroxyproline N-acetylglucosaminyltransferase [Diplonema papillatum]|nr:[Skp1-protein]-hydroxyproline N-acetylglucosaminyltransferase [Diplonema papillatum]
MPVTKFSLVWILMGLAVFVYVLQIGTITKRTILRKPAWADIGALAQPSGGKAEPCVTGPNVEPLPVVASANHTGPPTIFVSVAAFRDVETNATLHSLFSRALYPQRVFVGLVCQVDWNNPAELCVPPKVWEQECGTQEWCPMDQIRMRTFDAGRARGPTFARHLASLLYRGEDYFMMIDSHNRFVKHWDQVVIDEHAKTGRMNSVLTTYPMAINPKDEEVEERSIAFLCALGKNAGWTSGFPGPYWANSYRAARYPKPQPYLGAGLVFGPGRMVCALVRSEGRGRGFAAHTT